MKRCSAAKFTVIAICIGVSLAFAAQPLWLALHLVFSKYHTHSHCCQHYSHETGQKTLAVGAAGIPAHLHHCPICASAAVKIPLAPAFQAGGKVLRSPLPQDFVVCASELWLFQVRRTRQTRAPPLVAQVTFLVYGNYHKGMDYENNMQIGQ